MYYIVIIIVGLWLIILHLPGSKVSQDFRSLPCTPRLDHGNAVCMESPAASCIAPSRHGAALGGHSRASYQAVWPAMRDGRVAKAALGAREVSHWPQAMRHYHTLHHRSLPGRAKSRSSRHTLPRLVHYVVRYLVSLITSYVTSSRSSRRTLLRIVYYVIRAASRSTICRPRVASCSTLQSQTIWPPSYRNEWEDRSCKPAVYKCPLLIVLMWNKV